MTREEAKAYIIQHCIPNYPKMDKTEWDAAMGKAIEALRQPDPRSFSCGQENDMVSRRAAIDIIEAGRLTKLIDAETAVNGLRGLPSAQPERMKGRWTPHREKSREYIGATLIYVTYDYWSCDTCGYRVEDGQPLYNFCPHCGADMRGREDERFDKQKDSN